MKCLFSILITLSLLESIFVLVTALAGNDECGTFNATEKLSCDNVFDRFHKCEAAFIKKALELSNPFTLCTNSATYIPYTNMTLYFKLLNDELDVKHLNLTCSEEFLNQNQMTIITTIVETSNKLWNTANCNDCYNGTSSILQKYSNHTLDIFALHSNYSNCTNSQKNASLICNKCEKFYFDLNSRFEMEKKSREGNICFDLEDLMNKTRKEWSGTFKCCKDKKDSLKGFYSLFASVVTITILFYLTVYFTGSNIQDAGFLDDQSVPSLMPTTQPSTSSSGSQRPKKFSKKQTKNPSLVINNDSDDEILIKEASPTASNNTNLILIDE